jgi:hypothetical protein
MNPMNVDLEEASAEASAADVDFAADAEWDVATETAVVIKKLLSLSEKRQAL